MSGAQSAKSGTMILWFYHYKQFLGKLLPSHHLQNHIRRQRLLWGKTLLMGSCRVTLPTASELTWALAMRLAGEPEPHAYGRPADRLTMWPAAFSPLCSPCRSSAGAPSHPEESPVFLKKDRETQLVSAFLKLPLGWEPYHQLSTCFKSYLIVLFSHFIFSFY